MLLGYGTLYFWRAWYGYVVKTTGNIHAMNIPAQAGAGQVTLDLFPGQSKHQPDGNGIPPSKAGTWN